MKKHRSSNTWIVAIFFLACAFHQVNSFTRDLEEKLRNRLLSGYNNEVRPDAQTPVFMLFHVTSLSNVDLRNELFGISGFWSMRWTDDRLAWSGVNNFSNIPVVQFSPSRVWTPVIVVSNSLDNLSAISEDSIPLRVDKTGVVTWSPPGLVKVSCTMDVSYFPWDEQTCGIEITSFGYTVQEMNIRVFDDGLSFRYYSDSGEWDIIDTDAQRSEYSEDGYSYARVTYYITVQRKPLYYGLNYLLPVMVCSALALFVFLLPPESGEKIGYCLTVLLAFMVILTLVAEDLPTTASSTSILQVYIALVLIVGGISVVLSIINLHLFFLPYTKPIGPCTRRVVTFFATAFCLKGYCCGKESKVQPNTPPIDYDNMEMSRRDKRKISHENSRQQDQYQGPYENISYSHSPYNHYNNNSNNTTSSRHHDRPQLVKEMSGIGGFNRQNSTLGQDSGKPRSKNEIANSLTWQDISRISDSIMLRIYFLFLVVSSAVFVPLLVTGSGNH